MCRRSRAKRGPRACRTRRMTSCHLSPQTKSCKQFVRETIHRSSVDEKWSSLEDTPERCGLPTSGGRLATNISDSRILDCIHSRTLRTQMGDKYSKLQISTTHPIVGWAIRHTSWILTRYLRHADGKTSYERRWQRPYASHCASLAKKLCMLNRRRSYRNTPYDSTQASGLEDARFRMRIWLWMVASCFGPEQYDDFQKDQNDGITKQCNDLQSMLPIRLRFPTFRRRGEMCPNMTRWMND